MSRVLSHKDRLVIASHNQGKVVEIADLLRPLEIEFVGARELGLDEPEETGQTFIENAVLKAELAAKAAQMPALADDSGLVVNALGGPRASIPPAGQALKRILTMLCAV